MFFYRRFIPGLAIQTYLIGDESAGKAAVIDPSRDVEELVEVAENEGLEITDILETHVHADFVSGSRELKHRLEYKPLIHCSAMGGKEWLPRYADREVAEGDEVKVGNLILRARHTPGHTPEHVMWVLSEKGKSPIWLFTGDLLFVGDVGRPDLLGEKEKERLSHELYRSLFETLSAFEDSMEIFPAHGAGSVCGKAIGGRPFSTIGEERKSNPSLKREEESKWTRRLMEQMPPAPRYFPRMKEINVEGPDVIGKTWPGHHPLSVEQFRKKMEQGSLVLDCRSKEAFSSVHIPGSINIPFSPQISNWAGWVLPYERPLLLVLDNEEQLREVKVQLLRVGFDRIEGWLKDGIRSWEASGEPLGRIKGVDVKQLRHEKDKVCILDVRTDSEWEQGHIEGALHLYLGRLPHRMETVPKDRSVAIVCGSGYRASIAASLLSREGYEGVINVFGGMSAWKNLGFPTVNQ